MSVSVTQTVKDIDNNEKKQAFKSKKNEKKGSKSPLTKGMFILPKEKN